ncbi:hypothetical protein PP1_030050 [Pseudonocardia sp. P1]|nr:hypothetical protein Ae707Ps1_5870c [Pseudonocardia sp. Ae707_Ps1]
MFVRVVTGAVTVEETDDLTRLSVVSDLATAAVDGELRRSGLGTMDGDTDAALDLEVLRERARGTATATDWDAGWKKMIDYATGAGWVSQTGKTVRAHLEQER